MFMIIIMFIKMVANCYIKCYNNELNKCCYSMETQVPISIICTSQNECIYVSNSIAYACSISYSYVPIEKEPSQLSIKHRQRALYQ